MQRYRLTRNFALISAVVMLAAAVGLAFVVRSLSNSQIEQMAEEQNAISTRLLANEVWTEFEAFLARTRGQSDEEVRKHPALDDLLNSVASILRNTPVLKVKLYTNDGRTAFSTAPEQIGSDYSDNPRFLKAIEGGRASKLEFRETFGGVDGTAEDVWVLSTYLPVRLPEGGGIVGVAEIYNDVTSSHAYADRMGFLHMAIVAGVLLTLFVFLVAVVRRAEKQIERHHRHNLTLTSTVARAEAAAEEKSKFLANMSHELRTPLNAIIGFAEILRDRENFPINRHRRREYADDIYNAGRHLLKIIGDVLDMVKMDAGRLDPELEELDAGELAQSTINLMETEAEKAGVNLTLNLPGQPVKLKSDPTKLRQIMINLLSNAVKFTPSGGEIQVSVRSNPATGIVSFAVTDTGIGMRDEDIPIALSPFGQIEQPDHRNNGGAGLGLALSLKFAEFLGGDLTLSSRRNAGTTAMLMLPDRAVETQMLVEDAA